MYVGSSLIKFLIIEIGVAYSAREESNEIADGLWLSGVVNDERREIKI